MAHDERPMSYFKLVDFCYAIESADEPIQLIIHAQQAGAENQSHEPSNFSKTAHQIIDNILLFLNVGSLCYGENSHEICVFLTCPPGLFCTSKIHLIVLLLARGQATGHFKETCGALRF